MTIPSDTPPPWWHIELDKEVERRDRELAGRIDRVEDRVKVIEHASPERRLVRLEDQLQKLTYTLITFMFGVPAATVGLLSLVDFLSS